MLLKDKIAILKKLEMFSDYTDYVIKNIADVMEVMTVKRGQNIITKGEAGKSMYILFEGKAKVHDDDVKIADLVPFNIIGEMALLTSEPRNATVTSTEDCQLLVLNQQAFDVISDDNLDFYKSVVKILIKKLQKQNAELIDFSKNARKILATF